MKNSKRFDITMGATYRIIAGPKRSIGIVGALIKYDFNLVCPFTLVADDGQKYRGYAVKPALLAHGKGAES